MKNKSLYMLSLCLLMPKISQSGGKISTARTPQPTPTQPTPQDSPQTGANTTVTELSAEAENPAPASKKPVVPKGTITCNFNDPKNIRPLFSKLHDGASLKAFDQSFKHSNIWFINASYEKMKSTIEDTAFNKGKITNLPFEKKSFAQAKAEGRLAEFELYEWLIVKPYNHSRDGKNKFMSEPVLLVLVDFNQSTPE